MAAFTVAFAALFVRDRRKPAAPAEAGTGELSSEKAYQMLRAFPLPAALSVLEGVTEADILAHLGVRTAMLKVIDTYRYPSSPSCPEHAQATVALFDLCNVLGVHEDQLLDTRSATWRRLDSLLAAQYENGALSAMSGRQVRIP